MSERFAGPAYLVCGDARTGSSLLISTLRATRIAGKPYEYFGVAEIDKPWMREQLHVPDSEPFTGFPAWRDYILRAGAENGGVFGASVHWFQADTLHQTFQRPGETLAATLLRVFPNLRLVRLRRRNLVAQAVSHHVAIVSNIWNSTSAPDRKPGEIDVGAPYDFAAIDQQVSNARLGAQGWAQRLAALQDITLALTYEELAADLEAGVRRVLAHVGVTAEGVAIRPALRKQAGAWSLELERRYRAERRASGRGPVGDEAEI
jgi:LPS sulfotransferase NodH